MKNDGENVLESLNARNYFAARNTKENNRALFYILQLWGLSFYAKWTEYI